MPTLIIKRLVKPGHEKDYEQNLEKLIDHSEHMDGYMGINVVRPTNKAYPLYVFTAKFDTEEHLQKFKESNFRQTWLKLIHEITQSPIKERTINKHDWWFALPGTHADIPRYKMVIVTTLAAYPVVFGLNVFQDHQQDLVALALRTLFIVTITISTISYITMPILLNVFKHWLYIADEKSFKRI